MNYNEALNRLFSRLPAFSDAGKSALNPKLDNIKALVDALALDLDTVKYIHVAGTNGKGSTCHILSAVLQEAGLKVGLLTSPHLVDLRERVKINGQMIGEDCVVEFVQKIEELQLSFSPSYFEMNVALGFYAFIKEGVDIAVIETGLGGRWDSTNIITPELSVITSIDYDHTDILGETLDKIAYEKAGIIKKGQPVLIGKKQPETLPVFTQVSLAQGAPLFFAEDFWVYFSLPELPSPDVSSQYKYFLDIEKNSKTMVGTDLQGSYQWDNLRTAWAAVRILSNYGWHVNDSVFISAVKKVKKTTSFRGRWDIYRHNIILDVGHNPEGIGEAVKNLRRVNKKYLIVYGSVRDKDVKTCVGLLPEGADYYICQADVARAMPVQELEKVFVNHHKAVFYRAVSVSDAVEKALANLDEETCLLITGSFFIVGEAYRYLDSRFR